MATNRKKREQGLRKLSSMQISELVNGDHLIDINDPAFQSEEEHREAWRLNRNWLMQVKDFESYFFGGMIMAEGTKPCAYYQFEKGLIFGKDFEFERELTPDKTGWIVRFKPIK